MNMNGSPLNHGAAGVWAACILAAGMAGLAILYILAFIRSHRRGRSWPPHRLILWLSGASAAIVGIFTSSPAQAHAGFVAHMVSHLLFGMLAPLLMALARPVTLLLRALDVTHARNLASLLKMPPLRFVTHPAVAGILNIGGLWLLYATDVFGKMHANPFCYLSVHGHLFIAGYVFSSAILGNEPNPHPSSHVFRALILILALAGHSILSKYVYAHPPAGVPASEAEAGAMLMYYGGDAVEALLIFFFCRTWYVAVRPRPRLPQVKG